jgi:hypothetical protein
MSKQSRARNRAKKQQRHNEGCAESRPVDIPQHVIPDLPEDGDKEMHPEMKHATQRIMLIPIKNLISDSRYQRNLRASVIAAIAKNFDPAKLGVLRVSRRGKFLFAVIDGQHRLEALRQLGYTEVLCSVQDNLTVQDEAECFRTQYENAHDLSPYDLFRASVSAGDQFYMSLNDALNKHNYAVGRASGARCIAAIGLLTKIASAFGFDTLDKTLGYIDSAWLDDPLVIQSIMLAGMAEFAHRFAEHIDARAFKTRVAKQPPFEMVREFKRRSSGAGSNKSAFNPLMRYAMCAVVVEVYNKGLNSRAATRLRLAPYQEI